MAKKVQISRRSNEERVQGLKLSSSKSGSSNSKSSSKSQRSNGKAISKRGGNKGGKVVNGNTIIVKSEYSMAGKLNNGVRLNATQIGESSARITNYMENHGGEDLVQEDLKNDVKNLSTLYHENGERMTTEEYKESMREFNKEEGVQANRVIIIDNGSSMTREEMKQQVLDTMDKYQEKTGKDLNYKFAVHTDKVEMGGTVHAHILVTGDNKDIKMTKAQLNDFKDITAESAEKIMGERNFFERLHHRRIDRELEKVRDEKLEQTVSKEDKKEVKEMLQSLKGGQVNTNDSTKKDNNKQEIQKVERQSNPIRIEDTNGKMSSVINDRNQARTNKDDITYREKQHEFFNLQMVKDNGFNKQSLESFVAKRVADKDNKMTKESGQHYVKNMENHAKQLEAAGIFEKNREGNYSFTDGKSKEILYDNSEKSFKDIAKTNILEYKKAVEDNQKNKDISLKSDNLATKSQPNAQKHNSKTITIRTDEKTLDDAKRERDSLKLEGSKEVFKEKITRYTKEDFSSKEFEAKLKTEISDVRKDRDSLNHLNPESKELRAKQEQFYNLQMVKNDGYSRADAESYANYAVTKNHMSNEDSQQFLKNSENQAIKMEQAGVLEKNGEGNYSFTDEKAKEVLYKNSDKSSNEITKENVEEFKKAEKMQHEFKAEQSKSQEQDLNKNLTLHQQLDKAIDGKLDNKANALQH